MSDVIDADVVYKRIEHVLGDDAAREDVAWLLSKAKFRASVTDEIRDLVLDRFEPVRDPIPFLDYLPLPAHCTASDCPEHVLREPELVPEHAAAVTP